ncbi:LOW QUALITY PROTEIN: U3 snoRNA associated [Colletotrichum tofieldiae]|nr:LOW QUALITY PROTEIN: U3 snoRNA associated [Colletotrichum tofieldiae]
MVTTRNGKRTAAEAPATVTTKKQKLPVRSKDGKAAPKKTSSKKDESSRPASKKRSSLVVELRSEANSADAQEVHEQQIITGAEQPAPEPKSEDGKVINDSDASVSDDQVAEEEPAAEKTKALVAEGDDGSDSDEAPEAVSTSKAAVQAKKSAQAANKAIAEQQAAQKRKRQERNARLQEQAAARKAQEDAAPADESNEEVEKADAAPAPETTGRRRLNKLDLPPSSQPSTSTPTRRTRVATARRTGSPARRLHTAEAQIARESRGPKDEVVGSTLFRVVKKEDERLAPKAQKYSVNAKRALLARGRAPVKARKGFLV